MNENNEGTGVEKNIHLSDKTFSLWAEIKVHRVSFCQVFFFFISFYSFFPSGNVAMGRLLGSIRPRKSEVIILASCTLQEM